VKKVDYKINDDQIKTLLHALVDFDSKGFYEVMDEVRKNPVKE
jgi:hypothetical protein